MPSYLVRSVPDLLEDRGRTAAAAEELAELDVDLLVTATPGTPDPRSPIARGPVRGGTAARRSFPAVAQEPVGRLGIETLVDGHALAAQVLGILLVEAVRVQAHASVARVRQPPATARG